MNGSCNSVSRTEQAHTPTLSSSHPAARCTSPLHLGPGPVRWVFSRAAVASSRVCHNRHSLHHRSSTTQRARARHARSLERGTRPARPPRASSHTFARPLAPSSASPSSSSSHTNLDMLARSRILSHAHRKLSMSAVLKGRSPHGHKPRQQHRRRYLPRLPAFFLCCTAAPHTRDKHQGTTDGNKEELQQQQHMSGSSNEQLPAATPPQSELQPEPELFPDPGPVPELTMSSVTDPDLSLSDDSLMSLDSPTSSSSSSLSATSSTVLSSAESSVRYVSWAAVVAGVQQLDAHGEVAGYLPSASTSHAPALFHPHPRRASLRPPSTPSVSASTSASLSLSFSLSPSPPPPRGDVTTIAHLPNEVIDTIFRYLSSRPRAPEPLWDSPIDAANAMSLALTCTRMCALFRARLVAIRTRPERYREDLLYSPPSAGAVIDARSPRDVEHLSAVLKLAGPALKELLITKSLPRTSWVYAYVASVTDLKKLSLRDVNAEYPLERILEASSRTLKELEIVGATGMALSEQQLHALATHCSSVHTLALRLSMFDHDWTSVWMGIGPGLEKLSLGATRFWIMDTEEEVLLQQIGRYCIDIKHLHFYHLGPTLGNACARLCDRYGDQLQTLELEQSQMLRPDIELLAMGCPNTEVSISHGSSLFSHAYNVDVIDLLGRQITTLRYRSQLAHDESLWEVGQHCTDLRELRLDCASTLTEAALESILKATAPQLHNLSMSFFVRGLERALASSALVLLARYARELRDLHIGGQKFEMEPFSELVLNCKKSLRKVSITFGFRTAGDREVIETPTLVDVVTSLYPCEKLTSLVIIDRTSNDTRSDSAELRQACYPFRKQMSRVSICGIDYVR